MYCRLKFIVRQALALDEYDTNILYFHIQKKSSYMFYYRCALDYAVAVGAPGVGALKKYFHVIFLSKGGKNGCLICTLQLDMK